MSELVTPDMVANRQAEWLQSTGGTPDEVSNMYFGAWLACQAGIELGEQADAEQIQAHLQPLFRQGDEAVQNQAYIAASDVQEGNYGTLAPKEALVTLAGLLRRHLVMREFNESSWAFPVDLTIANEQLEGEQ